mmetsp:Transcript_5074/g.12715  ORF Transcript_5074/g.12715 Transcript_5074/m.12715 type:complete len:218 (+) Transcript_5074:66-719(+)
MRSGRTHSPNWAEVKSPKASPASMSDVPSLCAFFATFVALSYPMCGFSAVTSIRLDAMRSPMRPSFATIPDTHLSVKATEQSASKRVDDSKAMAMTGLKTLSSKWPWAPPNWAVAQSPTTRAATMVTASHCVGFTLPGMIELPGSFSGNEISPRPLRGPLPSSLKSLAILFKAQAVAANCPQASTMASWAARAANLFGAVSKARPVSFAMSCAIATS